MNGCRGSVPQFIEVVPASRRFQTIIVHREAFHDVLTEPLCGPDPELRAAKRPDSVADRDDHIEVVVLGGVLFAIGGSYPEIPDN